MIGHALIPNDPCVRCRCHYTSTAAAASLVMVWTPMNLVAPYSVPQRFRSRFPVTIMAVHAFTDLCLLVRRLSPSKELPGTVPHAVSRVDIGCLVECSWSSAGVAGRTACTPARRHSDVRRGAHRAQPVPGRHVQLSARDAADQLLRSQAGTVALCTPRYALQRCVRAIYMSHSTSTYHATAPTSLATPRLWDPTGMWRASAACSMMVKPSGLSSAHGAAPRCAAGAAGGAAGGAWCVSWPGAASVASSRA